MGFLDHYRQFEAMTEEEVNAIKRARAAEEKRKALARVEPLDLSRTTWPGLPHPDVVAAITYAARRGLHRYVDPRAGALRSELAHRHGVGADRIVIGNGAAQLLAAAAGRLLGPGDELVCPWPTYPLYPVMARRAGGHAVPITGFSAELLHAAVNERTRVIAICNPNDPTGELMAAGALDALLGDLPERVVVLLDEALVDYVADERQDATVALLERHPRLLLFRSFSKAWGLAGLRCGYAIGPPASAALLDELEPELGVHDLAQAGTLEALRITSRSIAARAREVATLRERVLAGARELGVEAPPSQANVVWLAAPGLDGAELARRLEHHGVIVQPGGALGAPDRVRASVHRSQDADRLLRALELSL